jgi:hypothetical protein
MHFVLKPVSGDDLNIGVFGGASRQKFFLSRAYMFNSIIGEDDPSTGRP